MRSTLLLVLLLAPAAAQDRPADADWSARIRPLLARYCLDCHSTKDRKGDLDLERFRTLDEVRKDLRAWIHLPERLETGEMPPKKRPKPSDAERRDLAA